MAERLKDAVVLLSGAGGGIGTALTEALLAAGVAEIISAGRDHPPAHDRVREDTVDITHLPTVRALAERHADRLTVLIACAGVNANQRLFPPGFEEAARREMDVNSFGLLNLATAFAPAMQARGSGLFVHLLTFLAHVNLPLMAGYCASKAGVNALLDGLRVELEPVGIAVSTICPGWIRTPLTENLDVPHPFLMEPDYAARRIIEALRRRRPFFAFPRATLRRVRLLRWLPPGPSDWLVRRMMAAFRKKQAKND